MNAPTKLQIEADRVYAVTSFLPYQDTVHKWLLETKEYAIKEMAESDDAIANAKARGRYSAVTEILDRIDSVIQRREAESLRLAKQHAKEMTHE